jgi:phospholipase C
MQEADREDTESYHVEQSRQVTWNMYQDRKPQFCRDPPLTKDSLVRKAKEAEETQDMSPRAAA